MPEHEVSTSGAEEREFAVGTLQSHRILHDAIGIGTMFQTKGMAKLVNGFFFKTVEDGRTTDGGLVLRVAVESVT